MFQAFFSRLGISRGSGGRKKSRGKCRARRPRPWVEELEQRFLLANDFFTVPGGAPDQFQVRFDQTARDPSAPSEVGVYLVQDEAGRVAGLLPSDPGYAAAALENAQVLFGQTEGAGERTELTFSGGDRLGFYLIPNGTGTVLLADNLSNSLGRTPAGFFSFDQANPDGVDHVQSPAGAGQTRTFSWEASPGGGDQDFNDVVFQVHAQKAQDPKPIKGLVAVPGEPGQTVRVQLTLTRRRTTFRNELGLFLVDDPSGRIGNLSPGDPGYAAAALSDPSRWVVFKRSHRVGKVRRLELPGGSHFAFYLVQNSTTQRFLDRNPDNQLGHRPVVFFSFRTPNPDNFNHLDRLSGSRYAFEDRTRGGDRDFNDLVVKLRLGQPRGTPTGSDIPTITARLGNDTAPGGGTNTDRITSDPSIVGTVTSSRPITHFGAGFDATPVTSFVDVLADLQPDGRFTFDRARMHQIAGGQLPDGPHVLHLQATDERGQASRIFHLAFLLETTPSAAGPAGISRLSPAPGESLVSVTRETIVRFDESIDPSTITADSFFLIANGVRVPGTIRVSSTERFATFFPAGPLPPSTEVRIVVDGDRIVGRDGMRLDADGDGNPGGVARADFRTLPLTRIPGTNVSGRVVDAFNRNPDGSDIPIVGATIRVDGFPEANAVTDADGRFTLVDMPAPEFFVHIDGTTATNAPPATVYPSVGKAFHSVPGQSTVLNMNGVSFSIHLPPMALGDVTALPAGQATNVGFGPAGKAQLRQMFPNIDPAMWDRVRVTFAPNTAIDDLGNVATQAVIIPVPPDRLPAPLPPDQTPRLVISIQPLGATNFDTPAPVALPNTDGLPPGAKSLIWSFNHDAGRWEVIGTGTVSADGMMIVSDPGVGILAPGWHFTNTGTMGSGAGPGVDPTTGVPCLLPVLPVNPIEPIVSTAGLDSRLLTRDDQKFTIRLTNAAVVPPELRDDPCELANLITPRLVYQIDVDGPAGQFLRGLDDGEYILDPGAEVEFEVSMVPLAARLPTLVNDQLYGARVNVRAWSTDNPSLMLLDRSFGLARWLSVTDPNGLTNRALFYKTIADGPGGFVQQKRVDYFLPETGPTTFATAAPGINLGQPLSGSGVATWTFDPDTQAAFSRTQQADLDITIDGQAIPQPLRLQTRSNRPQVISPNRAGLEALLNAYLGDGRNFDGLDGDDASDHFKTAFAGAIFTGPGTPEQQAARSLVIAQIAADMQAAVMADYAGVNLGGVGYTVVESGGDTNALWMGTIIDPELNRNVLGLSDHDATLSLLRAALPDPKLSPSASEWVLTEALGNSSGDVARVEVVLHANFWNGRTSFGNFLGNSMSHELGHTLGLFDAYVFSGNGGATPVYPADIMGPASPGDVDEYFSSEHVSVLFAAAGLARPGTLEDAVYIVRKNFNAPDSKVGLREHTNPATDVGVVVATVDGRDFSGDGVQVLNFGGRLADGVGGQLTSRTVVIRNEGTAPVTINGASLQSGLYFRLVGPSLAGTVLGPAQTATLDLVFDPTAVGSFTDTLVINSDSTLLPAFQMSLAGTGMTPDAQIQLSLRPDADTGLPQNNLGGLKISDPAKTITNFATITNTGGAALTISEIGTDDPLGQFAVSGLPAGFDPGNPIVLQPGESVRFNVTFDAKNPGLQRGQIRIISSDPDQPVLVQKMVATGLPDGPVQRSLKDNFVLLLRPDGQFPLRTRTDVNGRFSFVLPGNAPYELRIFDPTTGLIGTVFDRSEPAGENTIFERPVFRASDAPDSDGDGLPDDIELTIGINPSSPDTDNDGIDDFAEIDQGLDPFGGGAFPTGVISALPLLGPAQSVIVEGNTAFVATGSHGLALVDVADFQLPIVLGQIDLGGNAVDVGVDVSRNIAVVAATTGLHLVNVADPMLPTLIQTVDVDAKQVEVIDGIAYAVEGKDIVAVDILTGEVLQRLTVSSFTDAAALASDGPTLYAHLGLGPFLVIDAARRGAMAVVGEVGVDVSTAPPSIAVGGGTAFVVANGIWAVDVSDPTAPNLLRNADTFFPARGGSLNGSGLIAIASGTQGLRLFDVSDPIQAPALITQFMMPGSARNVQIASGIAFVAGDTAGLVTINYLPFDALGLAPTVAIASGVPDLDPGTPGVQVIEGTPIRVNLNVIDDVQVRRVEFIVNGQVVRTDVSFPFRFEAIAPLLATSSGVINVQVRATDTGGNQSLSNILTFLSSPDTFPPTVVGTLPAEGGASGLRSISVSFNEPINPALVNASGVTLTFLGADGVLGGGNDVAVTSFTLELRDGNRTLVVYPPASLNPGKYQLTINPSIIADRAGNALAAPFTVNVEKRGALAPINFGQVVSDELVDLGEIDSYTFTGTAGQRIYVDGLFDGSDDGITIRLKRPDGQVVYTFGSTIVDSDPRTLPLSGTYTIEIGVPNGILDSDVGAYAFRVLDAGVAPPIFLDQPVNGTLDPRAGAVLFRFTGTAGQQVFFDSLAGGIGGGWTLFNLNDQPMNLFTSLQSDFQVTIPVDGIYILVLFGDNQSTAPIPFSFKLVTPQSGGGGINFGQIITDTLEQAAESKEYAFNGTAGQRIYFDALRDTGLGGMDVSLMRPDATVQLLSTRADRNVGPFTLMQTGEHKILIGSQSSGIGEFSFRLLDVSSAPLVTVDGPVINGAIDTPRGAAFFRVSGSTGQRLVFDALGAGANGWDPLNAVFDLFGPANQLIQGDLPQLDFGATLPAAGEYAILVEETEGDPTRTFSFQVLNQQIVNQGSLSFGQTFSGMLTTAAEAHEYTFNGTAGQRIWIDSLSRSIGIDIDLRLFGPSGTQIALEFDARSDMGLLSLPATGTYRLVFGAHTGATGSYNYRLVDTATATPLSLGATIVDTLNPPHRANFYRFNAVAGQTFNFDSIVGVFFASAILYGPTFTTPLRTISISSDFSQLLSETGTYLLVISSSNNFAVDPIAYEFQATVQ